MNFGEVIQNWKESVMWIDGIINPFVKKDMSGIWPSPAVQDEVIILFT